MTAQKLTSPCRSCWLEWEDKNACAPECQLIENYRALLEKRPAVNIAARMAKERVLWQQIMAGVTKSHPGNRAPRIKWTDAMMRTALEARRQGMNMEDAAKVIGVGRKWLAKRFKEAGVDTSRQWSALDRQGKRAKRMAGAVG